MNKIFTRHVYAPGEDTPRSTLYFTARGSDPLVKERAHASAEASCSEKLSGDRLNLRQRVATGNVGIKTSSPDHLSSGSPLCRAALAYSSPVRNGVEKCREALTRQGIVEGVTPPSNRVGVADVAECPAARQSFMTTLRKILVGVYTFGCCCWFLVFGFDDLRNHESVRPVECEGDK